MRCFKHLVQNCIAVGELPPFSVTFPLFAVLGTNNQLPIGGTSPIRWQDVSAGAGVNGLGSYYVTTPSVGGNQRHNNVSPCIAAYVWKCKA